MKAMKMLRPFTMLDDAPWTWGYKWSGDAYEDKDFFEGADVKNHGVYHNVYDQLDDSPVTWHITEVCQLLKNVGWGVIILTVSLITASGCW